MKIRETGLAGVYLMEPTVFADERGWFMESFSLRELQKAGIDAVFVQDNHSFSAKKGTLRGLHFQTAPMAQAKLVRCTRGSVWDVAVDLRKGSPQYRRWFAAELSGENRLQLFIPRGFAHGYLTLTDFTEVEYKTDRYFSPQHDRSVRYDDPAIGIPWNVSEPVLSHKDRNAPLLEDSDAGFVFGGDAL